MIHDNDNVDGNVFALRQYERQQDRQDEAWEYIKAEIQPMLDEIKLLVDQCYGASDDSDYDFEEEIKEEIINTIEG